MKGFIKLDVFVHLGVFNMFIYKLRPKLLLSFMLNHINNKLIISAFRNKARRTLQNINTKYYFFYILFNRTSIIAMVVFKLPSCMYKDCLIII